MCPQQNFIFLLEDERCLVCRRFLHPGDNDWPFCSPACRRIDEETAVLLLPGPPEEVNYGDSGH